MLPSPRLLFLSFALPQQKNQHKFHLSIEKTPELFHTHHPLVLKSSINVDEDSSEKNEQEAKSRYDVFLDWLSKASPENSFVGPIEIRPSLVGGGFGTFTTRDVKEGELLFTVPQEARLTIDVALSDPDCGEAFSKLMDAAGPGGSLVALAGYVAKEWLLLNSRYDDGDSSYESFFEPYLRTLPWEEGKNMQEHILFWSDEDMDLFEGSVAKEDALGLREEVEYATKVLRGIIVPPVKRAIAGETNDDSGWKFPWEKKKETDLELEGYEDAVRGAFVTLITRSFQTENGAEELRPMFDLLQHKNTANVKSSTKDEDTIEVRARADMSLGEELFNQYQTGLQPYRYFTRFGFIPGEATSGRKLLEKKSPLFFPAAV